MSTWESSDDSEDETIGEESSPTTSNEDSSNISRIESLVKEFWDEVNHRMTQLTMEDFRCCDLPLARIKKIMKLDENVKMISAEAPIVLSKAADLFIQELTMRAWASTVEGRRRTLQRGDVAAAASLNEQFDFLIDILPREEALHSPNTQMNEESFGEERDTPNCIEAGVYNYWAPTQEPLNNAIQTNAMPLQDSAPYYLVNVSDNQMMMSAGVHPDNSVIQLSPEQLEQLLAMSSHGTAQYSPYLILSDQTPVQMATAIPPDQQGLDNLRYQDNLNNM